MMFKICVRSSYRTEKVKDSLQSVLCLLLLLVFCLPRLCCFEARLHCFLANRLHLCPCKVMTASGFRKPLVIYTPCV